MSKPGPLCSKCPLKDAPGPVWGEGNANATLVIVGQCPGPEEITQGRPFVGGSGGILDRSLSRNGFSRSEAFVTNAVKCFVQPRHPVPNGAIRCCEPLLAKELAAIDTYTTILTLGQEAFHAFTGKKMLTVSPPRSLKKPPNPDHWLRGCVYLINSTRVIIPAAHPAYVASTGFRDVTYLDADVAKAIRFARGQGVRYEEHYDYHPTSQQVLEYVQEIENVGDFGLDYETPEKDAVEEEEELLGGGKTEIQVAGLSHAPGYCLGVPGDMLSLLKGLFTNKRSKPLYCRVFNWGFEGYHTQRQFGDLSVIPVDLMLQLNRCYSDLKRKDLGTALSLFTDMPYTKNLGRSDPDRYNACDTYGTLVGSRNAQAFMEALRIWKPLLIADMPLYKWAIECKQLGVNCDVDEAGRLELKMMMALGKYEEWWDSKLSNVNWQSPQQLIALFTAMKLPVQYKVRVKKDKSRVRTPCCDEDVLEMYRDKYQNQIAGLILTMRTLKKASDFTRIYSSDGRAHPSHKIHGQRAGRIQAINPDLQNVPEELAGIYPRTIIIPDDPDNDCIITADYEAAEFFIYGYAANDGPILRARKEGVYIYGLFYEEIFHKPFFEPNRPPKKAYRRKDIPPWELLVAKSGPLGMLYGRGAKSLQDGFGIPQSQSFKIYDGFMQEHWAVARHHNDLLSEAGRYGFLRNFFDRIRWFPHLQTMRNEILAYTGQSNLADILIRSMNLIYTGIQNFGGRLLFPVHDSIQVSIPRKALWAGVSFMRECLEIPLPEMNNFWIPCTIKVGTRETSTTGKPNWGDTQVWEDWIAEHTGATRHVQGVSTGAQVK